MMGKYKAGENPGRSIFRLFKISVNYFIFSAVLSLFFVPFLFAEIPIYCPCCKTHLYNYQKDEIKPGDELKAEDFKPANKKIIQPVEGTPMVCPLDGCPLNQYESWAWERKMSLPVFKVWAISLLTKDKNGNWKGVPYDIKVEDWEGKH